MDRIKSQIEAQIQEIVFFGSIIVSFSIFLSGILFLTLSPESLTFILGSFGAAIVSGLFAVIGYGFFYFAVMALHMGYITNFHVFNFKDLKREYPVLIYSLVSHLIILTLFATLLSVFQVYLEVSNNPPGHGSGGVIGALFGPHFYSALGIYGSLLILVALKIASAIAAGFFELPDLMIALKSATKTTSRVTVKSAKTLNTHLLNGAQFFLKGNEFSEATAGTLSRSFNRANHIFTEHFHIYRNSEPVVVKAPEKVEKLEKVEKKDKNDLKTTPKVEIKAETKIETKKSATKTKGSSAMAAKSERLMNSLKELKKMTSISKSAPTPLSRVALAKQSIEKATKKKAATVKSKAKKK